MIDVMYKGRVPHMKCFADGIIANHDRFSGIKRYETSDLEKWISEYDVSNSVLRKNLVSIIAMCAPQKKAQSLTGPKCILEIPSYLGMRCLEGYINDPDVKFIVTERSPEKWAKSINNTIGAALILASSFPMNILKPFDTELTEFWRLAQLMYLGYCDGKSPQDPDTEATLRQNYVE